MRVVIRREEYVSGAPMERPGVRDWKLIYPEQGFDVKTLCLGLVEVEPGHSTPLHRHRCEEVYYIVQGSGVVEVEGERHEISAGDAVYIPVNARHRVINTGRETLRYVAVGGVMLVPLLPEWPTPSPYEILEG